MLILTLHGLAGTTYNHYFMKKYLEKYLILNERLITDSYGYDSLSKSFDQVIKEFGEYLDGYAWVNDDEKVILVCHSLGGVIATHMSHARIKGVVTISSPHTKCDFAKFFKDTLPEKVSTLFLGQMYDALVSAPKPSVVPYIICITSSWNPWYKFDGRVYTEEMVHPQANKILHLEYSDHIVQLYDPRMWRLVYEAVDEITKL